MKVHDRGHCAGIVFLDGSERQRDEEVRVEVEVVGLSGGHRGGERVAVAASRAPDALQVVRLRGRHGAQHHGGEVADVDTELQGGRRGEQALAVSP